MNQIILPNGAVHPIPDEPQPNLFGAPQAPEPYDYKREALEEAVQCWTDEGTKDILIDMRIAAAVATRLAEWMKVAERGFRGAEYYQGLLDQCGRHIGVEAFTAEDGTVQQEVVAAKLPELVKDLVDLGKNEFRD